jgi:uncharacterized repeat protein (TIGR01451 family)
MKRSAGLLIVILVTVFVGLPAAFGEAPQAQAGTPVQVKVRITRVVELRCDEGAGEACPNDYYPKFEVDHQGLFDGEANGLCCAHPTGDPPEFTTSNWFHEKTVDSDRSPVDINIQLWDQDDVTQDTAMDIAPGQDDDYLDLKFNLNTCTFEGDGLTTQQGAGVPTLLQGQTEGLRNDDNTDEARVYFTITTPPCIAQANNTDTDGDSLNNGWEVPDGGIDSNGDSTPEFKLNSDPTHRDLFVEIDYMACSAGGCVAGDTHSHAPAGGVKDDVVAAFRNSPVSNPDGTQGITLHWEQDEAIPDAVRIFTEQDGPGATDDRYDIRLGFPRGNPCQNGKFGTPTERSLLNCADVLAAKKKAFRYAVFAHSYLILTPARCTDAMDNDSDGSVDGSVNDGCPQDGSTPETVAQCANAVNDDPSDDGVVNDGCPAVGNPEQNSHPRSSGWGENGSKADGRASGGDDFFVTLGEWTPAGITDARGQRSAEASTFMHEFGHTLGLRHGGDTHDNCKPNYLSVMNYTLQFQTIDVSRPLDFTSAARGTALNQLVEGSLNENNGIGGPAGRLTVYGVNGNQRTAQANQTPIDWNEVNGNTETSATADINFISTIGGCATRSPNQTLNGFDDWQNIVYNFRDSAFFNDGAHGAGPLELTEEAVRLMANPPPDLHASKSVDKPSAIGGDTLNYTVTVTNLEPPKAVNVALNDVLPDNSTQTRALPDLDQGASNTQTFTYVVPCSTADGAVLKNRASVTGTNTLGFADVNLDNNSAEALTSVQAPKLTITKSAPASVNSGEAIAYTIAYQNNGSGGATNVTITDTLPGELYYSKALDLGTGPQPNAVTLNANGTRTLSWQVGSLAGNSGAQTIQYTARPSLLFLGGESLSNNARLTFTNANGCTYVPVTSSASTTINVVPPSQDPQGLGFWRNHPELEAAEILARIQATDVRFEGADGTSPDGALSLAEAQAVLVPGGNMDKVLEEQLLGTYFNLATRRINAGTLIQSRTAVRLGLTNVRDAALYAIGTLPLPVNSANRTRYSDATRVLDEINTNRSEVY